MKTDDLIPVAQFQIEYNSERDSENRKEPATGSASDQVQEAAAPYGRTAARAARVAGTVLDQVTRGSKGGTVTLTVGLHPELLALFVEKVRLEHEGQRARQAREAAEGEDGYDPKRG